MNPSYLQLKDGSKIAYHKLPANDTAKPSIIFIHGFKSDMEGAKALAIEEFCQTKSLGFIRFDCTGHGSSSGDFLDGTIGRWSEDLISVIDDLSEGPQILIGSSMGGWLMLLSALKRPDRIAGLIGIAAAPDFTEELIWNALSEEDKEALLRDGIYHQPNEYTDSYDEEPEPYIITQLLVEEARNNLLLAQPIKINCPIRLIHGQKDADVPVETASRIKEKLASDDVEIIISPEGDHRMSNSADIELITSTLENLLKSLSSNG